MRRWNPRHGVLALCSLLALAACGGEETPEADMEEAPAAEGDAMEGETGEAMDEMGGGLLDPETATRDELMGVEGIDGAVADAIIANRPYADMTALDAVLAESLDEAGREEVYRHVWKPLDLNTASEEEILLIPGVGERMLHEFEEYRPYQAMAQFRREMGKYVDEEEVARLEQYVTIR